MPKRLSDEVVAKRMVELRNLRKLHAHDQKQIVELKAENKHLKTMLAEQKAYFEAIIENQNARIAELETMVFGRKPKGGLPTKVNNYIPKQDRNKSSYRRPLPPASAITSEEHHTAANCHRCGNALTEKTEAVRYEEDILVAAFDLTNQGKHKTVAKHTIETGWCSKCGQYSSACDLRGQVVTIGPNVRSLIVYLVMQADLTYSQIIDIIWQLYRFKINGGEIANILSKRRVDYLPMYEQLKTSVRAGPVHMDETRLPIQSEQNAGYAHVMVGVDGALNEHDVVFCLADSRGKGNAEKLVGENYSHVGITDRYGSYKHLFETVDAGTRVIQTNHQICWAHLHRNARDITRLECLDKAKQTHVKRFYDKLAGIYTCIREIHTEPYDQARRQTKANELLAQALELCKPHALDPKKLKDLKAGILEYQDSLFLCLTVDGIPADNNKAERAIRKLVIKRKKSFGVKTLKGARTMEVLVSVCQSLYNRDRDNFLANLHGLATVSE